MMARGLMVEGGGGEVGMVASNSETLFLLCMVVMYLSILSMVIFACGLRGGGGRSGHSCGHRDDGVDFRGGGVKGEGVIVEVEIWEVIFKLINGQGIDVGGGGGGHGGGDFGGGGIDFGSGGGGCGERGGGGDGGGDGVF